MQMKCDAKQKESTKQNTNKKRGKRILNSSHNLVSNVKTHTHTSQSTMVIVCWPIFWAKS